MAMIWMQSFSLPFAWPATSTKEDVLTSAEVQQAAARLGVTLKEKVVGPWYQMELFKGDQLLGKTSGWAQPWGSMHLETIEVRKFTGYWVKQSTPGAEEERTDVDVGKVARWFGLLLSVSIACWNRERSPFFCKEAQLLAIKDEEEQHKTLVRYYKGLGFEVVQDADEISFQDQVLWGGLGTLMTVKEEDFMRKWTPVVRGLAGSKP